MSILNKNRGGTGGGEGGSSHDTEIWFAGKESCWYYSLSPGTSGEKLPGAGEGAGEEQINWGASVCKHQKAEAELQDCLLFTEGAQRLEFPEFSQTLPTVQLRPFLRAGFLVLFVVS